MVLHKHLLAGLAAEVRNHGSVGRPTHGDVQIGPFILRSIERFRKEVHGRWRVGQGDQTNTVQGRQQHAHSDAYALIHIIVGLFPGIIGGVVHLFEYDDEAGASSMNGFT